MKSSALKLKLMSIPAVSYILIATLYPLYKTVELSFSKIIIKGSQIESTYVGVTNFIRVLQDEVFHNSLIVTLVFSATSVILELILGLLLAIIIASIKRNRVLILLMVISMMLPPVSVALIWRFMLYPNIGLFDNLTRMLLGFSIPWLGDPFWAKISIIFVDVWHWTGFVFLIVYAGYVSLPVEQFEAAYIDGASDFQTFMYITLPLLRPTIALAAFFRIIDVLQAFPELWQLTFGGPAYATTILNILVYVATFDFHDLGYAAVVSLILIMIALATTIAYYKLRR